MAVAVVVVVAVAGAGAVVVVVVVAAAAAVVAVVVVETHNLHNDATNRSGWLQALGPLGPTSCERTICRIANYTIHKLMKQILLCLLQIAYSNYDLIKQ